MAAVRAAPDTISINGNKVGSGRVEQLNPNIFSADDAADVGIDEGTNVSSAYRQHGKVHRPAEKLKVGRANSQRPQILRTDVASVGSPL